MWTQRKNTTAIGDRQGASRIAGYLLEAADSPHAFGPGGAEPRPMAYWLGSGEALEKLGLAPGREVATEELILALQGRSTDGRQVRRPGWIHQRSRDGQGRIKRDPGGRPVVEKRLGVANYDLTFSPPKSVSVLWSQAGPELRAQIERAIFEAWNVAAEHMIRSHDVVMQGRAGGERPYGPASGFAAAVSLHVKARRAAGEPAPAPQLHLHGELLGVLRGDGKLAALYSKAIFGDAALEADAYALTHLAESLVAMGFEIECETGRDGFYFEIKGIPGDLIEEFSGRAKEVEAAAKEREADRDGKEITKRERAALAMITRLAKEEDLSSEAIEEWWRERCKAQGFDLEAIAALTGRPGFSADPAEAREAIARALERGMRSRGPAVTRAAARGIVVAAASGRLSLAEAENVIDELQGKGALLPLQDGWVTTPYIRAKELGVMAVVEEANARRRRPLSPEAIAAGERVANAGLGKHTLDPEQQKAIADLSQGAGWSLLTGRAGTGKTPVLQALAEAHRKDGWKVIACSISWENAQKLGKDVGAEPISITQVVEQAKRGDLVIDRETLILIDEAGKIGLEAWHDLAELVKRSGARLIGVGHAGQLGAPELPGMFEEMTLRPGVVEVAELREVRRHEHEWMRELQEAIDDGRGKDAVRILEKHQAITFYPTKEQALDGQVEHWLKSRQAWGEHEAVMILQGSNKDVAELNRLAQERLLELGLLGGPGVDAPGLPYKFHAGSLVVLRDAAWSFPRDENGYQPPALTNGTTGVVRRVDPRRGLMEVEVGKPGDPNRRIVTIDLRRGPRKQKGSERKDPSWRLSYARLSDPSQGLTITSTGHGSGSPHQSQESSYVGLSRQTHELHEHVNCEGFNGTTPEEWREELARLYSHSRRHQASIRHAEDPGRKVSSQDRAAGRTLPEPMASELEALPGWRQRPLAAELDPLAPHRSVLGERRAAWIEERAQRYAQAVGRMHPEMLQAELATAREAFESLDRQGALKTLGLERDREALDQRRRQDLGHAASLEREAKKLKGRKAKAEREALRETARTQQRLAEAGERDISALRAEERALREDGTHLDDWMREEGDTAARYLALERELFSRRERRLEEEIGEVLRDPPQDVAEFAGPAPEHGSPERSEWEGVVWERERNRLVAEGLLPGAAPSARGLRDLGMRAERLRARSGVDPAPELGQEA